MHSKVLLVAAIALINALFTSASLANNLAPIAYFDFQGNLDNQVADSTYTLTSNRGTVVFDEDQGLAVSGEKLTFTLDLTDPEPANSQVSILMRVLITDLKPAWGVWLQGKKTISPWERRDFDAYWQHVESGSFAHNMVIGGTSNIYYSDTMPGWDDYNFADLPPANQWLTLGFINGRLWVDGEYYANPGSYYLSYSSNYYEPLDLLLNMGSHDETLYLSHLIVFDQILTGEDQLYLMDKYLAAVPEPSMLSLMALGLLGMGILIRHRH